MGEEASDPEQGAEVRRAQQLPCLCIALRFLTLLITFFSRACYSLTTRPLVCDRSELVKTEQSYGVALKKIHDFYSAPLKKQVEADTCRPFNGLSLTFHCLFTDFSLPRIDLSLPLQRISTLVLPQVGAAGKKKTLLTQNEWNVVFRELCAPQQRLDLSRPNRQACTPCTARAAGEQRETAVSRGGGGGVEGR